MARRLRVINIDDFNQLDPELYAPFVEVLPIRSELRAQELLARMSGANRDPIDIFLIDIDMSDNWQHHPKGLNWGPDQDGVATSLRPYGPLLAVPFLASSAHVICVPYSNWWASPAICENGFVLLSCAFIFSRAYGRAWTLEETRDHIRARITAPSLGVPSAGSVRAGATEVNGKAKPDEGPDAEEESLLQEPEKALRKGLVLLRQELRKAPGVQFVNVEATCRKLAALDEAAQHHIVPLTDPDTRTPITIEWVSAQRWEQVEISSLYADVLDFRTETDQVTVRRIAELLQAEFVPQSIENAGTLYDLSKDALNRCLPQSDAPQRLDKVLKALKKEVHSRLQPDEWQLIKRLAVLFAWVRAWREEEAPEKRITRVRQYLGFGRGQDNATNIYKRLIRGGDTPTVTKGRWNQPFKKQHSHGKVAEDFNLDVDQPEALTTLESRFCLRFADEELRWLEDSPAPGQKYPRWMTEPDVTPHALA